MSIPLGKHQIVEYQGNPENQRKGDQKGYYKPGGERANKARTHSCCSVKRGNEAKPYQSRQNHTGCRGGCEKPEFLKAERIGDGNKISHRNDQSSCRTGQQRKKSSDFIRINSRSDRIYECHMLQIPDAYGWRCSKNVEFG